MKAKFRIDDRIRHKNSGRAGRIIISIFNDSKIGYYVLYDDDSECYIVDESEIDFECPEKAFLANLRDLLKKFNAKIIAAGEGTDSASIDIYFDRNRHIYSQDWVHEECCAEITAQNIIIDGEK